MKSIYLIRHAKSDWNNPELADYERTLNKRGVRDAKFMSEKLIELNFNPDLIVSSPSQRTTDTAELLFKTTSCLFDMSIYEASLDNLTHLINMLSNGHKEVALIAHNPSITLLSNYLTNNFISNMPTCSVVKIELEIEHWNEITQGIGTKKDFIYPKMYLKPTH